MIKLKRVYDPIASSDGAELSAAPAAVDPVLNAAQTRSVTLLYSSHDAKHNNAAALKDYLEARISKKRLPRKRVA